MGRVAQYRVALLAVAVAALLAACAAQTARQPVPSQLVAEASIPGLAHARFWGDEAPANILTFAQTHMPNARVMASKLSRQTRPPAGGVPRHLGWGG